MTRRLGRLLARHPALALGCAGLVGLLVWSALDLRRDHSAAADAFFLAWTTLLRPFGWVATVIAPVTDRWPGPLDAAVTLALGLTPYLAADRVVARLRRGRALARRSREA